ncbi:uncharacterized protein L969DRAFT_84795 [Mixia osmundae IAM 14324]|uniref:Hemerythrin-like domain-containing protein n=1 Tax=Mixia osmundae (strain CBS 9802 / IAM 14324 / JCM 22182 / KY 12970) TaxID=764103 RepID=G7DTA6_MIXOS|nr:uncharacterized protein L969DRAFT_84795 [Mixia osmundae IAM 14324]KEI42909.1 hypothetical protein L969DRAFT_84795 [Mixia osmundae IAM 14324]GAA93753.1 hypothetical protein E5Q_00399 [Mixia osmundae IAM 14324]
MSAIAAISNEKRQAIAAINASKIWSRSELSDWDRIADHMDSFHNHFRQTFEHVYRHAEDYRMLGLSLNSFLAQAMSLYTHLNMHHSIEERFIFPHLSQRMPQFAHGEQHTREHQEMHKGLERYSAYIKTAQQTPSKYDGSELRAIMSELGSVLMPHMDAEVTSLKGASLRQYWAFDELKSFPM